MAGTGEISVLAMGAGGLVYEILEEGIHHHLVCQVCGRVITLEYGEVQAFFDAVERSHDFKIATNHLVLFGLCADCAGRGNSYSPQYHLRYSSRCPAQ